MPFSAVPVARNVLPSPTQSSLDRLSMSHVTHRGETLPGVLRYLYSPCGGAVPIVLSHSFTVCHSHDPTSSLGARGKCPHLCVLSMMAGSQEAFRSVCSKKDRGNKAENPESTSSLQCSVSPQQDCAHQGSTDVCWGLTVCKMCF